MHFRMANDIRRSRITLNRGFSVTDGAELMVEGAKVRCGANLDNTTFGAANPGRRANSRRERDSEARLGRRPGSRLEHQSWHQHYPPT